MLIHSILGGDPCRSITVAKNRPLSEQCCAIFVSLELSRSTWLITSLSPGSGEKMSKYGVLAGDLAALLADSRPQAEGVRADGKILFIVVIQEAGLDGFWIHRVLQSEGIESYVVDPASIATSRRRRRAKTDRIDGEALVRALLATNEANRASAPSSARQRPKTKTIAGFAVSARR